MYVVVLCVVPGWWCIAVTSVHASVADATFGTARRLGDVRWPTIYEDRFLNQESAGYFILRFILRCIALM